ncbi:cell division protein FtsA [Candidatus Dojkabacteria bacterium]|nr:cell division protein FtsA [Candidatus Dojkabacteria bacterium]
MAGRIVAALDVGSSKICTTIASIEENKQPAVIGVASYPSKGMKKGVIVNIDEAINAIAASLEAAERMAGLTISSVYVSINGKHITSTNNKGVVAVAQDEIITDDVFRAIESARTVSIPPSREILHVIPREFIVDAQGGIKDPVGMTGTRLEVDAHIVSATSTALHNLVKCVQQLGLRVEDVVFSGWAASTAVLTATEKELGVALLDIGGGTTSITTFVEDAITYSGCVPFGGNNITSDLAIGLRVSLEDAEKIKVNAAELIKGGNAPQTGFDREYEYRRQKEEEKEEPKAKRGKDVIDVSNLEIEGMKTISKKMFDEILEARMSEIFDIVIDQVEQSRDEIKLPAGVVLTGGSAMVPGITQIAKKVFGVPARVGYPKGLGGLVDEINNPGFAVSQGLILYGSQDEAGGKGVGVSVGSKGGDGGGLFGRIGDFVKNLLP